VDSDDYLWDDTDGTLLWGRQTGSNPTNARLYTKNSSGTITQVFDFSDDTWIGTQSSRFTATSNEPIIHQIIAYDEVVFVDLRDTSSLHYLYRSTDGGSTFSYVQPIGESGGTHTPNVSILGTRGMVQATIGGTTNYIFGEYNTYQSRTTGGANDWVRVWRATSASGSFSVLGEWNTDGSRYVLHCHYVGQEEPNGTIFIGMGDGGQSGIITWDGSTSFVSNQLPEDYTGSGHKGLGGNTKTQTTDLLFVDGIVVNPCDNQNQGGAPFDGHQGIWITNKVLGS
jgi:hypothetical protein